MKSRYLFAFVLVLLGAALACAGMQEEVVNPFQEVRVGGSQGSGTVVKLGDETLVLTAAHVVQSAKDSGEAIFIRREHGRTATSIEADIVHYSAPEESGGDDLALLKPVSTKGLTPAALGLDQKLTPGRDCWYIGCPDGLHASLERSIINKPEHYMRYPGKVQKMFLVNGHVWFGNSGGGVYVRTDDGRLVLVGVVTRKITAGPKSPGGCEHPETIKKFLDSYKKGGK